MFPKLQHGRPALNTQATIIMEMIPTCKQTAMDFNEGLTYSDAAVSSSLSEPRFWV